MVEAIVESVDKFLASKQPDDPFRVIKFGDYGNGVAKYSNQPIASEMLREPVKTMLDFVLHACVVAKRPVVITAGFKKAADKHVKIKLNPSAEWDNGSWASWCAASMTLIIQHLQRLHVNKKVYEQVVKKMEAVDIPLLDTFIGIAKLEAVVKVEPGALSGEQSVAIASPMVSPRASVASSQASSLGVHVDYSSWGGGHMLGSCLRGDSIPPPVLDRRLDADDRLSDAEGPGKPDGGSKRKHAAKVTAGKRGKTPMALTASQAFAAASATEPVTPHKGITMKRPTCPEEVTPAKLLARDASSKMKPAKLLAHDALIKIKPESVWLDHVPGRMTMVLVKADGRAYCTVNVNGARQQWGGFSKGEAESVGSTSMVLCGELFRAIEVDKLSRPQATDRRDAILDSLKSES